MREKGTCTLRRNIKLCRLFAIVFHLRLQIVLGGGFLRVLREENPFGSTRRHEQLQKMKIDPFHSSDSPFKFCKLF